MSTIQACYDYIIVGAGSAGCIVASRLAQAEPHLSICLIEAGPNIPADDTAVWEPARWKLVQQRAQYEWGYQSVPQINLKNRIIPMGRARALGGCSVHNGMVYVRGGRYGFDNWFSQGCTGWDYESLVPFFQSVESEIIVTTAKHDDFILDLFNACQQVYSLPYNPDYNVLPCAYGCSLFQFLIDNSGRRETVYEVFIENRNLKNIQVVHGATVTRLLLDGTAAVGVQVTFRDTTLSIPIYSRQEIILSAGSIGSPQILMLSGIGDASELNRTGIKTVVNLPGVGQNLQDDLYVSLLFTTKVPMPPQPYGLMGAVIFGCIPLGDNISSNSEPPFTNVECSLSSGSLLGLNLPKEFQQSYLIYPNFQLLQSRGTITLASGNPFDPPLIDPNYLSAPNDIQHCLEALTFARKIGNSPALSNWRLAEIYPGPGVKNTAEMVDYVRATASTCYHYAGTCKMGADSMSVVNPLLQVNGISNLRIIDASIIPVTVSGNTAAATMMIAARGASMILETLRGRQANNLNHE